ncbi:hypothetical protein TIFTF001_001277, partial [Ficus carica]
PPKL